MDVIGAGTGLGSSSGSGERSREGTRNPLEEMDERLRQHLGGESDEEATYSAAYAYAERTALAALSRKPDISQRIGRSAAFIAGTIAAVLTGQFVHGLTEHADWTKFTQAISQRVETIVSALLLISATRTVMGNSVRVVVFSNAPTPVVAEENDGSGMQHMNRWGNVEDFLERVAMDPEAAAYGGSVGSTLG